MTMTRSPVSLGVEPSTTASTEPLWSKSPTAANAAGRPPPLCDAAAWLTSDRNDDARTGRKRGASESIACCIAGGSCSAKPTSVTHELGGAGRSDVDRVEEQQLETAGGE